jgi:hypothetical protein
MHREKKTELPTWRRLSAPLRVLPDFAIVSVERGGTTSLYRYVCEHPCAAEAFRKEVHFFDMNWSRGLGWYRAHFPTRAEAAWVRVRRGHRLVTGEASPYYLYHPHVPARLARVTPRIRIIALLRNPVERAYSHYHLNVRQGKEPLSFEEAIEREPERLRGEWERLCADETCWSDAHYQWGYLDRGLYADRLLEWRKHFAPEQMLVILSEEMYADPAAALDRVNAFVGLPPWRPADFKAFNQKPYPGVAPETRRKLAAFFEPHNQRLRELLGRDLGWS